MNVVQAFSVVFETAIQRAEMDEDVETRVAHLTESITFQVN